MINIFYVFISFFIVCSFSVAMGTVHNSTVDLRLPLDANAINSSNSPKFKNPALQKYRDLHDGKKWKEDINKQNVIDRTIIFTRRGIEIEQINPLNQKPVNNHKKFLNEMKAVARDAALHSGNNSKKSDLIYSELQIPIFIKTPWTNEED